MSTVLIYSLKSLSLPPGLNILCCCVGILLVIRWRRCGITLIAIGLGSLYVLSTPVVARGLAARLEVFPALSSAEAVSADAAAIVVLGAGRYRGAPEYGHDTVSGAGLERLRYAADLHRLTRLPLLLSGGSVFAEGPPEARLMQSVLETEFGVSAQWLETKSRNTAENAAGSAELLRELGLKRVLLVTHAYHMPRALRMFYRNGIAAIPAPTVFLSLPGSVPLLDVLPSAHALLLSRNVLHEFQGSLWYAVRYR